MDDSKNHISVNICTYRRNHLLERLLRKLALQETGGYFDFSVVVVDNDAAGPAREIVRTLQRELSLELIYDIEPVQTIPAARNHAFLLSKGNYIGIIDDDELPLLDWLVTLYRAIQAFDAFGALGPVYPFFETAPPTWLVKSGLCERPVHRTGTLLDWHQTRTGNVLLKKEVFDEHNLCFDLNHKTSGSDQQFFKEAIQYGYRFIAVAEAPVYEVVTPERQTRSYYLKRFTLQGANARKFSAPHLKGIAKLLTPIKVLAALIYSLLIIPFCFVLGNHAVLKYAAKASYHLSWLLAMSGLDLGRKRNL